MYLVNGYKFDTKNWSEGKKTFNCKVHVKDIIDKGKGTKTRVQLLYKIININMSKRYDPCDSFILEQKARQVYYVSDPNTCIYMSNWFITFRTKRKVTLKSTT
ncbi:hypothetical protein CR513_04469, partial [Mucuna pruriens]